MLFYAICYVIFIALYNCIYFWKCKSIKHGVSHCDRIFIQKMEMYGVLFVLVLIIYITMTMEKKTINILHITTNSRIHFDVSPVLGYALDIVNSRQDILPNHHVKAYTYNIGSVSIFFMQIYLLKAFCLFKREKNMKRFG